MLRASVVGGSGYTGGELVRLLLGHPQVELAQVTSQRQAGKYVHSVHPNLRRLCDKQFVPMEALEPCDVLFLALPHGRSARLLDRFQGLAPRIIDLSADFRLRAPADYPRWYGYDHPRPELLSRFIYGLPELHREELRRAGGAAGSGGPGGPVGGEECAARASGCPAGGEGCAAGASGCPAGGEGRQPAAPSCLISGTGCLATAAILGLAPLFRRRLAEPRVVLEAKVGSSAAGSEPSLATHHPERDGVMRSFCPTGHRHTAEIRQELAFGGDPPEVYMSATAVEAVRGALVTAHCFLRDPAPGPKDLWRIYREDYGAEPFVRLVMDRTGAYRYPEPKLLSGSNFCDLGFEREAGTARVVVMAALDNLVKGAAGNAVQAMNVALGLEERLGLEFCGLHPV